MRKKRRVCSPASLLCTPYKKGLYNQCAQATSFTRIIVDQLIFTSCPISYTVKIRLTMIQLFSDGHNWHQVHRVELAI